MFLPAGSCCQRVPDARFYDTTLLGDRYAGSKFAQYLLHLHDLFCRIIIVAMSLPACRGFRCFRYWEGAGYPQRTPMARLQICVCLGAPLVEALLLLCQGDFTYWLRVRSRDQDDTVALFF